MNREDFGWAQMAGCVGMLVCMVAALGLLLAMGGYTMATGDALRIPVVEIGVVWVVLLAVFEVMAFKWLMLRVVLIGAIGGALGALLAQAIRAAT
jgi:hypothetical protein